MKWFETLIVSIMCSVFVFYMMRTPTVIPAEVAPPPPPKPILETTSNVPSLRTSIPLASISAPYMEHLGLLAAQGQMESIDELALIADELYKNIDHEKEKKRVVANLVLMRAAFKPIGEAAGNGSTNAMNALFYANRIQRLRSFTPDAFGIAAGMGNREALDVLLNYQLHGFLLSQTVFAIQAASNKNIPEAVDFLVDVMSKPENKPLWLGASEGLVGAAYLGNKEAQEALKAYAKDK